jgi:flagellar motility protein MotE (MotC chaperone)
MARWPVLLLALLCAGAFVVLHLEDVLAATEVLVVPAHTPAVPRAPQAPATAENRVGAAIAAEASRRAASTGEQRSLSLQAAMMEAAEKRIEDKLARLAALEQERKGLGETAAGEREDSAQGVAALVQMYEAMRPKDAARVFQRLDIAMQVDMARRMRRRAMAAILAEMDPAAAERLSVALARPKDTLGTRL